MPQPKDKDWLNGYKNKTPIYVVYKRPTSRQGTHTDWKWRDGKKIFHANRDQKKAGVAILISDKIDFKTKAVKRDKERHCIMIKGSIEEDITIINIYASSIRAGEGNGTPLQYSCLENPMDRGAWRAAVHGFVKSWTRLSDFPFTFHFHALEKEMATHSSVLAWRIPGTEEPGRRPSMGSHRVGHDWSDLAAAAAAAT